MICDEDPLRRRPRESTARRKRQERCVWMARKMTEWPSKRGPITKIMPSDGCIGDTVPLAVGKWYDFHEFGWYMGNVGQDSQASLRALARRYGVNPKTIAKWRKRSSVHDLRTGPTDPRSTVLSAEDEAIVVAFRRHTLLPLDDCLYALQATIPWSDPLKVVQIC